MGSRYRCRVSPSGVPGCVGGTGDGAPNLLEVIHQLDSTPVAIATGITTELISIPLTLGEDEAVILHYESGFTNADDVTGDFLLRLLRDVDILDSSTSGPLAAARTATTDGFALDNPGPGTYEYRVTGTASDADFIVSFARLLIEVVRASVVTDIP